jgi:hypothetical protein
MRRIHLILLLLVPFGAAASAQSLVGPMAPAAPGGASAEDIVARVMSFDRNADGKVAREELLERMKGLVGRGDADGDGALDGNEVRTLARTPAPAGVRTGGFPAMYQLPAESWFPSRSHIEGAITDLKLESDAHGRALAVLDTHQQHLKTAAQAAAEHLLRDLESVLTAGQLADFRTALERPGPRPVFRLRQPAGAAPLSGGFVANAVLILDDHFFGNVTPGSILGRLINQYGLPAEKNREALAAIASYELNLDDLGKVERGALVERMRDILTEEERDDFRAALERRSAVAINGGFVRLPHDTSGVISVAPPIAAPSTR